MNPATAILIGRQLSRYKQALQAWPAQVAAQRHPVDAFRIASHKPVPGSLISSLRHLANSERSLAEQAVERKLKDHVDLIDASYPQFMTVMRLAQGHWPRFYRDLEEKRRKAPVSSSSPGAAD